MRRQISIAAAAVVVIVPTLAMLSSSAEAREHASQQGAAPFRTSPVKIRRQRSNGGTHAKSSDRNADKLAKPPLGTHEPGMQIPNLGDEPDLGQQSTDSMPGQQASVEPGTAS
jgi:hypothetical protein